LALGAAVGSGVYFGRGFLPIGIKSLLAAIIAIYAVVVLVIFDSAENIYNNLLYVYAKTGNVPKKFSKKYLKDSFVSKNKK